AQQLASRLGEVQGPPHLLEERQADALFQRLDLERDAWLAEVEGGGGARVAAMLSDGAEDAELMQIDVHGPPRRLIRKTYTLHEKLLLRIIPGTIYAIKEGAPLVLGPPRNGALAAWRRARRSNLYDHAVR